MIAVVVLAAGKSTRFPGNKLLAPVRGEAMIRRVVREALESRADVVIVVLGHDAERVRGALEDLDGGKLRLVFNQDYEAGMSSSIKAGVAAVKEEARAVLILPGDYALITRGAVDAVIEKYLEGAGRLLVASFQGRRGHPLLIDRDLFDEVLQISEEEQGLRKVVRAHEGELVVVEAGGPGVLVDVDTPEDYRRFVEGVEGA